MPESVPCTFDKKGWTPCPKPTTNGLCSQHEKARCASCKEQATRSCDAQMGGLGCGTSLCDSCHHSLEPESGHVNAQVYAVQYKEMMELRETGTESPRMLALRGVPTDIKLPRHLKELLMESIDDFSVKVCYELTLKTRLVGNWPAIIKDTRMAVVTPDRPAIFRVWKSLDPKDSELVQSPWMVHKQVGVGYAVGSTDFEQTQSRPQRVLSRQEIEDHFARTPRPFRWAPGFFGLEISPQRFEDLIRKSQ